MYAHQSLGGCWESFSITLPPYSSRKGFSIKPRAACLEIPIPRIYKQAALPVQRLDGFLEIPMLVFTLDQQVLYIPAWHASFQRATSLQPLIVLVEGGVN